VKKGSSNFVIVTSGEAFADAADAYREGRFGKTSRSDLPRPERRSDDRKDSSTRDRVSRRR
jgi:hypothetical protein